MNTVAMNAGYPADSGFLEGTLVQLFSTNPLMNSTKREKKRLSFPFIAVCRLLGWFFIFYYNEPPLSAAPLTVKKRKLQECL